MKYKKSNGLASEKIVYILIVVLLINLVSHFFQNVLGISNTYAMSNIAWILYFLYICFLNIRITKNEMFLFLIFCIGSVIAGVIGIYNGYLAVNSMVSTIFLLLTVFFTKVVTVNSTLSFNNLCRLLKLICLFAVISVIYFFLVQGEKFVPALLEGDTGAQWGIISFFRQRNIYAVFLFFAVVASFFLFLYQQRKRYLISAIAFLVIILSTDSRAALFSVILFGALYLFFRTKNKWLLFLIGIVVLIALVLQFNVFSLIQIRFGHDIGSGVDSGTIRLMMWKSVLDKIFEDVNFIFGYGRDSIPRFLQEIGHTFGSAHSVYIDCFFEGGIIQLLLIILCFKDSLVYIFKSKSDIYKQVWGSFIIAYAFYCLFESNNILFRSNFFSILATVMVVIIPKYIYITENNH